jgi:hypothetical protein
MAREEFKLGSSDDVLGELYNFGATEGEHEDDTPPPAVEQAADKSRKRGKSVSNTARTRVREKSDESAAEASVTTSTTRTPAGMRRHTVYIAAEVAAALDAVAERLVSDMNGMVPKHVVLGEIITAGIASADEVAERIRARLIAELQG